jgi:hypothetical protein
MLFRTRLAVCLALVILGSESWVLAGNNSPNTRKKAQLVLSDGDTISVEYSPLAVGSETPGQRLLDGKIWSPGTGQATTFKTSTILAIEDSKLPQGEYSLYLEPSGDGWNLVINQEIGQANSYPDGWDIVRAPMKKRELTTSVSQLAFSFEHEGPKGGTLKVRFGKTEISVPFKELPPDEQQMPDSS